MSRASRLLAAVLAAAALASCSVPPVEGTFTDGPAATPTGPAPAATGPARWQPCDDTAEEITGGRQNSGFRFSCATVRVPQDWAHPGRGTFDLALMRARSTDQARRTGSLLVNPGGPGASGIELAAYLSYAVPADVARRFDLVGFDPRGVGRSTEVACVPDRTKDQLAAADPDPVTDTAFRGLVELWRPAAAACGRRYGSTLGLFSTEQTARDLDAVRAAVGDAKTTYLGYSYGTLLGAVYARLFPRRIRALVLDGAVDPTADQVTSAEGQAAGFERAFDDFAADCRRRGDACPIGPDARATVTRVLTEVRARPPRARDGREVTAGYATTAIVASLYSQSQWTTLGRAVADLGDGDGRRVLSLADEYNQRREDGTYSNVLEANTAVTCADEATPASVSEARRLQGEWRARYPLFGAALATSLLNCAVWPGTHDPYPAGPARGAPPIVVVGTTGDPATPYRNTARLAALLGTGVVLTWEGEGHTAYPQTTCVARAVDAYLLRLEVPRPGLRCPAG
jgi:pimeloyl-ACP methyl ester carboxylesterase